MKKAVSSNVGSTSWIGDLSSIGLTEWNYDRAGHLLERAGFGGTPEEIRQLAALSPSEAVRRLVYYQQSCEPKIPPFRPTGFYPRNWNRRDNIRAFAALQNIRVPGKRNMAACPAELPPPATITVELRQSCLSMAVAA
jgi:hypothetical protein